MKKILISTLLMLSMISFAGGDYGGGPKVIELNKLDFQVSIGQMKLTKDKKLVELEVNYLRRQKGFDPFLSEKEWKKLQHGKFTTIRLKYDKDLFPDHVINTLNKRKKFSLFRSKKKYKQLARQHFTVENITNQINRKPNKQYYEVNMR